MAKTIDPFHAALTVQHIDFYEASLLPQLALRLQCCSDIMRVFFFKQS